jgi:hypothetical protein
MKVLRTCMVCFGEFEPECFQHPRVCQFCREELDNATIEDALASNHDQEDRYTRAVDREMA